MSCRFAATASTYGIKVYISYVGATDGRPQGSLREGAGAKGA